MDREKTIIKTSIVGIVANIFLAAFKAVVGLISHSVAIILDAVNNLTDALSSLITIIGAKLANKAPDKEHPYGHGRTEYISATVIAVIILYAGIMALEESIKNIIDPITPDYSSITLIIVGVAVIVKVLLSNYVTKKGKEVNSDSLIASGKDAGFDAIISSSTLIAAVIYLLSGVSLEAYLGLIISLIILKSGIEMLRETINKIIGIRVDAQLASDLKKTIASYPEVRGAYDLIVHDYGPDRLLASVHIEVPDTMTVAELDSLQREITREVYEKYNVILEGISVYSYNTLDEEAKQLREQVGTICSQFPEVLQMHGFYLDRSTDSIQFDVVVSYGTDRTDFYNRLLAALNENLPQYTYRITMDYDISD